MLCPLCQEECFSTDEIGVLPPTIRCPTQIAIPGGSPETHYIRYATGSWSTGSYTMEQAIVLPFRVQNHLRSNAKIQVTSKNGTKGEILLKPYSDISKLTNNPVYVHQTPGYVFESILEIPVLISLGIEEKLLQRIKLYILFS